MTTTVETIHEDLQELKSDLKFIKAVISEDFELSEHAKKALAEARTTPESEYVDL